MEDRCWRRLWEGTGAVCFGRAHTCEAQTPAHVLPTTTPGADHLASTPGAAAQLPAQEKAQAREARAVSTAFCDKSFSPKGVVVPPA